MNAYQKIKGVICLLCIVGLAQYGATKGGAPVVNITVLELDTPEEDPNGVDFKWAGKDGYSLAGKNIVIERKRIGTTEWKRVGKFGGTDIHGYVTGFSLDVTYDYRARVLEDGEE